MFTFEFFSYTRSTSSLYIAMLAKLVFLALFASCFYTVMWTDATPFTLKTNRLYSFMHTDLTAITFLAGFLSCSVGAKGSRSAIFASILVSAMWAPYFLFLLHFWDFIPLVSVRHAVTYCYRLRVWVGWV